MHLEWGEFYFGTSMGKKGILPAIRMGKHYRIFTHFNGRTADESGELLERQFSGCDSLNGLGSKRVHNFK
ncbi:unnamed protein product [Clavelina lepadiformis]|uniref:Uncharacterized protein n=1 Tax=Clavelina lepadiformis TaxID=159417 RepID=A0ABP0EZ28_CLALP